MWSIIWARRGIAQMSPASKTASRFALTRCSIVDLYERESVSLMRRDEANTCTNLRLTGGCVNTCEIVGSVESFGQGLQTGMAGDGLPGVGHFPCRERGTTEPRCSGSGHRKPPVCDKKPAKLDILLPEMCAPTSPSPSNPVRKVKRASLQRIFVT